MIWELVPHQSVGNIRFDMSRTEIRKVLGEEFQEFYRNKFSKQPTDHYKRLGIFIDYDDQQICEAIEMTSKAAPTFRGKSLLENPYEDIIRWVKEMDSELEEDDTGFTSKAFGFGLFAPDSQDNPFSTAEAVIAFRRGYYDV